MSMELEFNIISAKDLNEVNRVTTMSVYCVISLSGDSVHPQTATTPVHKKGGTSPTWNFSTTFIVNESLVQQNRLSLEVELISDRIARDTTIGTVHIPLKELLENNAADDSLRQVSYQVRKPSGEAKGPLDISYKFSKREGCSNPPQPGQKPQKKKKKKKKIIGAALQAAGVFVLGSTLDAGAETLIGEIVPDIGDDDS